VPQTNEKVDGRSWIIGVVEYWNKKRKTGMVEDWNIGKGAETDFVLSVTW